MWLGGSPILLDIAAVLPLKLQSIEVQEAGNGKKKKAAAAGFFLSFFLCLFSVSSFPPRGTSGGLGVFLVRAAWERRPEGPAYLLSTAMLLYLAVFVLDFWRPNVKIQNRGPKFPPTYNLKPKIKPLPPKFAEW